MSTRSMLVFALFLVIHYIASAQMPGPGYERAMKMRAEQMKVSPLDRDSVTLVDTVSIYDPNTSESETKIIANKISIRDYCVRYLGMGNADVLLDGQPHVIVDPKTFEDMTVRMNQSGKIDTIPKK